MNNNFITIDNLHKSFILGERTIDVLKGVSFSANKGEMIGIVGMSGAGKSTLLHIIGTLDSPTKGKVYFEGRDIFDLKNSNRLSDFRNQNIGFVFQYNQLLPEFTAAENVMMPARIYRKGEREAMERAEYLLSEVGLSDRLDHKPGELSGGEQQRVAIARALMNNPVVILADEPTGNLDGKTGDVIYNLLHRLSEELNQTFVISTHNERLMEKMDRVLRIVDGKIE